MGKSSTKPVGTTSQSAKKETQKEQETQQYKVGFLLNHVDSISNEIRGRCSLGRGLFKKGKINFRGIEPPIQVIDSIYLIGTEINMVRNETNLHRLPCFV